MINFFSENDFALNHKTDLTRWIETVVVLEGFEPGEINYIFCNDDYLLNINRQYLDHDAFTDIITFNNNEDRKMNADIYISTERVEDNAWKYKVSFMEELHRVLIHGILHLCGYNDQTTFQKQEMREKEDYYLSLRDFS